MSVVQEHEAHLQKQLYGIGIFEEEIVLSDFTDREEKRFVVTHEQLMEFFHADVTFRPFPGLVWMQRRTSAEVYLLTLPAKERTILYRRGHSPKRKGGSKKTATLTMRIPALAVKVEVDAASRRIQNIDMWGFFGRELKAETVLYELPLPNLSGSSLCLGSTERAATGSDLRGAVERTIFDTPFNWHRNIVGVEQIAFHDYHAKYGGRCPVKTMARLGTGKQILEAR
jgi:hypothetical protein